MSLLKSVPPAPVGSLDELFALAEAMEEEAAERYAVLASEMRTAGLPSVGNAFEHLAAEERGHAERVSGWSRARTGAVPNRAMIRWQPPETFDEEEARSIASSRLASAYRALSMAVRNEERAFALWTYIAAQSDNRDIQEAAERMAGEELRHAALLRRERRRAFHAERIGRNAGAGSRPRRPPADEAAHAEQALAYLLGELARRPAAPPGLQRLADESAQMAREAADLAPDSVEPDRPSPMPGSTDQASIGEEALRLCERTVEAYLDAADAASSEEAMRRLQALAGRAISRAATLRRVGED